MLNRKRFVTFACGLVLILSYGCVTTNPPGKTDGDSSQPSSTDIAGNYELVSVNGAPVPATVLHGDSRIEIHSGSFQIRADGTLSTTSVFSPPSGGKRAQKSHATYTRNGPNLVMLWQGAGENTGRLDGETFTMDNHGMIFVYSRSGPIDDGMQPDLASECDSSTVAAGIEKARPGVFDDFDAGLVAGRNRDGFPLGFLTFRDSDRSSVGISTTSEYPPLANEQAGNFVLQLDLEVKAWAGVIHNFENAAVNRWTPSDWRGFSEFCFWIYGNNDNTSLFVEILDNRKPCPKPAGAEVYTFPFRDDFSGWKKITVPFDQLVRKEIYNDAPNDGLGLSEVHGWAFGTLNTNGRVTYYLDDFELR